MVKLETTKSGAVVRRSNGNLSTASTLHPVRAVVPIHSPPNVAICLTRTVKDSPSCAVRHITNYVMVRAGAASYVKTDIPGVLHDDIVAYIQLWGGDLEK